MGGEGDEEEEKGCVGDLVKGKGEGAGGVNGEGGRRREVVRNKVEVFM